MLSSKTKKIIIFTVAVVIVLAILGGYKALQIRKQIAAFEKWHRHLQPSLLPK